ncbi:glycoside hydrolase family 15 protein [Neorhizobium lilium]|uniref:glycoside hydrolase family 15 protein n=1 Tax=Neorhizobium lilium TaxID=2503024 RepID=UPI001FDEDC85|nr:glycoside hydrolase family 15 protein [Neorhizobium lilium]
MSAAIKPTVPRPLSDHGAIGNLRTLALVARDGTIDFLCWPYLDSPSIFAALLDADRGGAFELSPKIKNARCLQLYVPESNVLTTRWLGESQSAQVTDLMPLPQEVDGPLSLIRRIEVSRGEIEFELRCWPRFDYARQKPDVTIEDGQAFFSVGDLTLRLSAPVSFVVENGGVSASFRLKAGETLDIVLDGNAGDLPEGEAVTAIIQQTVSYWQGWAKKSTYRGRWRGAVTRSALALKMLTSEKYGSIAAAGTFGLPEAPGGERNWDYRATWIRDASFTIYALMRLGYQDEANAFTHWLTERTERSDDGQLQIMYGLDGRRTPREIELPHLSGYGGARPVRIGNDAAGQVQLDIYGELLDSIYISNKYGEAISHRNWSGVREVVDHVCEIWQEPDAGIWEMRSEPSEQLHSRLMCWVAVDRAVRLAQKRSLSAPFGRWIETRNAISENIWQNFWNEKLGHFVHTKGGDNLDASMLMMPLVRFISATDPAWLSTLDAISAELADGCLVMRYRRDDALDGQEGYFAACSFWFVECLARAGRLEEARINMEKLLQLGNHLQLYSEEFDARGEFLGNFPQAFTHLALISAAFYLDGALDGRFSQWRP